MSTALTIPSIDAPSSAARLLEQSFVVLVLVLCGGAFVNLFLSPEALLDSGSGMPAFRYLWVTIYAVAITLLSRNCRSAFALLLRECPLVTLVLLAVISCSWSTSPEVTVRRSASLVGFTLVATYFAVRFPIREQIKLLVWSSGICVALSYLFGVFGLGHSVDDLPGVWFGIYTQRNGLGSAMSLSILIFLLWAMVRQDLKYFCGFLALAAFGLILLSGSITSLVVTAVVLLSFPIIRTLRALKSGKWLLVALLVALGVCAWRVASSFDTVADVMGRDASLTGRAEVWEASAALGSEKPWLGYGYNAFWLGLEGPSATVWRIAGWAAPSAHNGLLEIWLDLGVAGLAVAVSGFCWYARKAYRLTRNTAAWEFAWPLMFLIMLSVQNITESAFLGGNSIHWFLYVVVALDLSRFQKQALSGLLESTSGSTTLLRRSSLPEAVV